MEIMSSNQHLTAVITDYQQPPKAPVIKPSYYPIELIDPFELPQISEVVEIQSLKLKLKHSKKRPLKKLYRRE